MKKIDLHIHTLYTVSDSYKFNFSIDSLKKYVSQKNIDIIAITNHNRFNKKQYGEINNTLDIDVYPGVEVDLMGGHVLIISDNIKSEIEDFDKKCNSLSKFIFSQDDTLTMEQFYSVFPKDQIDNYLIIPHYDKKPHLKDEVIKDLNNYTTISTGEVSNAKKFIQSINNPLKLTPTLFSDSRMVPELNKYSNKQTYLVIDDVSLNTIKHALTDKNKVYLSEKDGHTLFNISDYFKASTGLNILLGGRSSGKTHTLNEIFINHDNVKYIKQFELVEQNPENSEETFKRKLSEDESVFSRNHLMEFNNILEKISKIDVQSTETFLKNYRNSLISHAENIDKQDYFSKTTLFQESRFPLQKLDNLIGLITSTMNIVDNVEYSDIIDKYVSKEQLKNMILELILEYRKLELLNYMKQVSNELVNDIQLELQQQTLVPKIEEIDFITIAEELIMINKFNELADIIKEDKVIKSDKLYDFTMEAKRKKYTGAGELKKTSKSREAFSQAFDKYNNPFDFLQELKKIQVVQLVDYYKYFCNIEFKILNKYGFPVSGGERAEFNFIRKIEDALQYDILLIDEPESSFDNIFLSHKINVQLKDISKKIPVIIATHNNTIGASIHPDYIIHTRKEIKDEEVTFKIYTGFPTNQTLKTINGESIENIIVQLDFLEAGKNSYDERKKNYEILSNK